MKKGYLASPRLEYILAHKSLFSLSTYCKLVKEVKLIMVCFFIPPKPQYNFPQLLQNFLQRQHFPQLCKNKLTKTYNNAKNNKNYLS